jgi:hypothetical protein
MPGTGHTKGPLTICPGCGSRLIYPTRVEYAADGARVSRRCPDCERRDVYLGDADLVDAWLRRQLSLWVALHTELAAGFADVR